MTFVSQFRALRARKLVKSVAAGLITLGVFAAGWLVGDYNARRSDQWGPERLISTAIDSVRANALDALPTDELLRRAMTGMLRELRDPYAALLRTDGMQQYRGILQGEGHGLGLVLRQGEALVQVLRVLPNSPAASAGIRAGDRILSVDGVSVAATAAEQQAADKPGTGHDTTRVVLWRPPVGDTLRIEMVRNRWHVPAVSDQAIIAEGVGYVALNSVSAKSSEELEEAVEQLLARGAKSLVLDLRGNGGGLFEEGIRVASLFLPRGVLVASLSGRAGAAPVAHRAKGSRWPDLPITVLVDARTASSAEIIAAALRDHNRALLVGETTYGKGFVQRVVNITPELSLRLTTARWLTPKGISLERRRGTGTQTTGGLTPDVIVSDASRRDPMSMPAGLTALASARLMRIADTAAAHALREGWAKTANAPFEPATVALLESRLRGSINAFVAPTTRPSARRDILVSEATRLATTRVLQVEGANEALLRYTVSADQTMRAAVEIVAPGSLLTHIETPATIRAAERNVKTTPDGARVEAKPQ